MAGLATCNPNYPITEWDRLIDQANLTLILLQTSQTNPNLSAYAYIFGQYNFNAHPLTPPGTQAIIHKKIGTQGSFDYNGVEGTAVDTDTLELLGHDIPIPKVDDKDTLQQASADVIHLLKNPEKINLPAFYKGDEAKNVFTSLAELLKRDK
eukprot:1650480-Ditylum_brightwellii.AAC.1